MKTRLWALLLAMFVLNSTFAQINYWKKIQAKNKNQNLTAIATDVNVNTQNIYYLDIESLKRDLKKTNLRGKSSVASEVLLTFPDKSGKFITYRVSELSTLHPDLAKKFPSVKSYIGIQTTNCGNVIRFSMGSDGFHGMLFKSGAKSQYIDPYAKIDSSYMVYS